MALQKLYSYFKQQTICFYTIKHNLYTDSPLQTSSQISKQGRMLIKFMKKNTEKRHKTKKTFEYPQKKTIESLISHPQVPQGKETRRQSILNALFMKHVTDLMSAGRIRELIGHGVEITDVKVTKDFTIANIHWTCEPQKGNEVKDILNKYARTLRSDLIGLHVMGKVPIINFVKDPFYGSVHDVLNLLQEADMGPPEIEMDDQNDANEDKSVDVGRMKSDVFGLDHSGLMKKVMLKKNPIKIHTNLSEEKSEHLTQSNVTTSTDIQKYLKEKKIMKAKKKKLDQSDQVNLYHEFIPNYSKDDYDDHDDPDDDDDYDIDYFEENDNK